MIRIHALTSFRAAALAVFVVAGQPQAGSAEQDRPLAALDAATATHAFAAADRGDWARVDELAGALDDPLTVKLLSWLRASRGDSAISFAEINAFLDAAPDWPYREGMLRRAEERLPGDVAAPALIAWFGEREPATAYGRYRLAAALLAQGSTNKAVELARRTWRNDTLSPAVEFSVRQTFGRVLSLADDHARLDALLWRGGFTAARRLYPHVDAGHRALAEARISLRLQQGDVDAAIAAVPRALRAAPGLTYERVRWRRKNGLEAEASALLETIEGDPVRPDLWWIERNALARAALAEGRYAQAYRLVRDHAMREPGGFSEAEWLAGWIALRFLSQPHAAKTHFVRMFKVVRFPISVARAAYWAGRASDAAGDGEDAGAWYRTAAAHPTTFYGRLAARKVSPQSEPRLPRDPHPSAEDEAAFAEHEFVRAIRMLAAHGQTGALRVFVRKLAEVNASPAWQVMTAALAREAGGADLGVATAKRAMRNGYDVFDCAYPVVPLPDLADASRHPVDPALVLAMIRQESGFNLAAISPSGARGLMQLMPRTAKQVAASLDVPFSTGRLTTDAGYNLKLGQAYVSGLLGAFGGSYVLAFAAYNAGPARVRQWMDAFGDPRERDVDVIDWIETIPFDETRNYVQRAIENMWVYQARLNENRFARADDLDG